MSGEIQAARRRYLHSMGVVDDQPWRSDAHPFAALGPAWPTQPAWRRIVNDDSVTFCSDGLSDPHEDLAANTGFGMEVLSQAKGDANDAPLCEVLFHLVRHVSNMVAAHGSFRASLESTQAAVFAIPTTLGLEEHTDWEGNVGVLVAFLSESRSSRDLPGEFTTDAGVVRVAFARLLSLEQWQAASQAPDTCRELLHELAAQGDAQRTVIVQPPTI